MKSDEPRQNFIFFMMGYITCNLNSNGVTEPDMVRIVSNGLVEKFLMDNKLPPLSNDEKKYVEQSEKWIGVLYKNAMERLEES